MKVLLQFLAVCSLLLAAPKAAGFAVRGQSGVTETNKLEIENLLYDAIFNSSGLTQYATQSLNTTADTQSQACLDIYTLRNVEILQMGGTRMRLCTFVREMDLKKYFNSHNGVTFKLHIMEKIAGCTRRSHAFRMLDCYVDTIAAGLSEVRNYDLDYYYFYEYHYNWRQNRCLQTELHRMIPKMYLESDRLKNCLQNVNDTRPCGTVPPSINSTSSNSSLTLPPWNNSTNSNSALPPWNNSTISNANETTPWITLPPGSNTTNSNVTNPWLTLPHWSNSTSSNSTVTPWNNSTNSNSNKTTPWVTLPPWNKSTISNMTNPRVTLSPWNNSTNSKNNLTTPLVTLPPYSNSTSSNVTNPCVTLPLWNNSTNSNATLPPWINNSSNSYISNNNSNANETKPWVTLPPCRNSTYSNVTNPWVTLPPWNNSTNSSSTLTPWINSTYYNATNPWVRLPPWSNFNFTLPPWSVNSNNSSTNLTNPWLTMLPWINSNNSKANVTSTWLTMPPWNISGIFNSSTNTNFSAPGFQQLFNSIEDNTNTTKVLHSLNDNTVPIQSPIVQTTESTTEAISPNSNNKPSWWSSMWHKVTSIFK